MFYSIYTVDGELIWSVFPSLSAVVVKAKNGNLHYYSWRVDNIDGNITIHS